MSTFRDSTRLEQGSWDEPGSDGADVGNDRRERPTTFVDHEVVDPTGHKLGKVSDVVSDNATLEPQWLVVQSGLLKHGHFVPVEGTYANEHGQIVVPHDKDVVMHAVKAHKDHVLTAQDERDLAAHYGVN